MLPPSCGCPAQFSPHPSTPGVGRSEEEDAEVLIVDGAVATQGLQALVVGFEHQGPQCLRRGTEPVIRRRLQKCRAIGGYGGRKTGRNAYCKAPASFLSWEISWQVLPRPLPGPPSSGRPPGARPPLHPTIYPHIAQSVLEQRLAGVITATLKDRPPHFLMDKSLPQLPPSNQPRFPLPLPPLLNGQSPPSSPALLPMPAAMPSQKANKALPRPSPSHQPCFLRLFSMDKQLPPLTSPASRACSLPFSVSCTVWSGWVQYVARSTLPLDSPCLWQQQQHKPRIVREEVCG